VWSFLVLFLSCRVLGCSCVFVCVTCFSSDRDAPLPPAVVPPPSLLNAQEIHTAPVHLLLNDATFRPIHTRPSPRVHTGPRQHCLRQVPEQNEFTHSAYLVSAGHRSPSPLSSHSHMTISSCSHTCVCVCCRVVCRVLCGVVLVVYLCALLVQCMVCACTIFRALFLCFCDLFLFLHRASATLPGAGT